MLNMKYLLEIQVIRNQKLPIIKDNRWIVEMTFVGGYKVTRYFEEHEEANYYVNMALKANCGYDQSSWI